MILGAAQDNPKVLMIGKYKPWEFGKLTVWQLKNLFGYNGVSNMPQVDARQAFWKASRIKGESEFSIWCRWHDEVESKLARG